MIKAVIFDLDGLLIDSEPLWAKADRILLAQRGIDYQGELREEMRGRGQRECAQIYISHFRLKESVENFIKDRWQVLYSLFGNLKLMPAAKNLVKKLWRAGFALTLATGGHHRQKAEEILAKFSLRDFFTLIISGLEVKKSKPFPDIYLLCAKKLKLLPSQCLVLEDAQNGVMAAKAAGMKVIGVNPDPKVREKLGEANLVVKSLKEINLDSIKKLEK